MAMVAMGVPRHITAMVVPVALGQVGGIPIEEGVEAGVTGDLIHPHGSETLKGSLRSSVDLTHLGDGPESAFPQNG